MKESNINLQYNARRETTKTANSSKRARINQQITAQEIRLIDQHGAQAGIMSPYEAWQLAQAAGLDLVEIAPKSVPPVCRIMDFGKYLFELGKRSKKKSKQVQIKEVKIRPVTDVGDYLVKTRKAIEFLQEGHKVKFTVRFRGRELAYQQQGLAILERIQLDLKDHGVVEQMPKMDGKQMIMIIVPGKLKAV